jgi:hypothetical protein
MMTNSVDGGRTIITRTIASREGASASRPPIATAAIPAAQRGSEFRLTVPMLNFVGQSSKAQQAATIIDLLIVKEYSLAVSARLNSHEPASPAYSPESGPGVVSFANPS